MTVAVETGYAPGAGHAVDRALAGEMPVAVEVDGAAYATMMATPVDLEDFATGFALAEGLVADISEIRDLSLHEAAGGRIVRLALAPERAGPWRERVRLRVSEGSCGLCGLESIEQVLRPLPSVSPSFRTSPAAVHAALAALSAHQPQGRLTGAMHAAAFCTPDGAIACVREDVGRHNALDKLVGALARQGADIAGGFVLVSARCSYELVEKTVRAGCPMLVAISAATDLAVQRARQSGLTLAALARDDTMLVFHDPARMLTEDGDGL